MSMYYIIYKRGSEWYNSVSSNKSELEKVRKGLEESKNVSNVSLIREVTGIFTVVVKR